MAEEIRMKNGGDVPVRTEKKKHYWWRYLLCFIAGTLFPGVVIASAVAIGGTVVKTRDLLAMLNISADEYLTEEYQNTTVLQMVRSLAGKKFETLQDIYTVTPFVKTVLEEKINPILQEFVHAEFTWEEISDKKFVETDGEVELLKYIEDAFPRKIQLVSFIGDTSSLGTLGDYLLYYEDEDSGEKIPYTIADFMDPEKDIFGTLLDTVTIRDLSPGLNFKLADLTLRELMNLNTDSMTIDQIIDVYYYDVYKDAEGNEYLDDGETVIDPSWTLVHEQSQAVMRKLGKTTIATLASGDVMSVIGTLRIDEIIEVKEDSEAILKKLGPVTINQLATGSVYAIISDLKINELLTIYEYDVYKDSDGNEHLDDGETVIDPSWTLVHKQSEAILRQLGTLTINELATSDLFDTIKTMKIKELIPDGGKLMGLFPDDFTLEDLTNEEKINKLSLNPFFSDVSGNPIITALFGDDENPTTIENISTKINDLTLGQVLTGTSGTILDNEAVKALKISEAGQILDVLTVEDVLGTSAVTTALNAKSTHDKALLSEVQDLMKLLTIEDVVGSSDNVFIKAIKDVKLFDPDTDIEKALSDAIEGVTIGTLFEGDSTFTDDPIMSVIWPSIKNSTVSDFPSAMADAFNDLTIEQLMGDDTTFTDDPIMSKIWPSIKDCTVSTFPSAMANAFKALKLTDMLGEQVYKSGGQTRNAVKISFDLKDSDVTKNSSGDITSVNPGDGKTLGDYITANVSMTNVNFTVDRHSGNYFLDYIPEAVTYDSTKDINNVLQAYEYVMGTSYSGTLSEAKLTVTKNGYEVTIEGYKAKEIDGSFWYLFTEGTEAFNDNSKNFLLKKGYAYTVDSDFDQMIDNFKVHMQNEKIRDLALAGFIQVADMSKLEDPIKVTIENPLAPGTYIEYKPNGDKKIGDYKLTELFEVIFNMV